MKLSILDQSPISANQTAKDALNTSLELARTGEVLGFTRYWIAEHHNLTGLACSAPEVMLAYIGAQTTSIRIGSGAVLLPHYKPFKIAEIFNMLATLFPNRIDIGIGRAPGGSAEVTNALSDNFLQNVWNMPSLVKELLLFLDDDFPLVNQYAKVSATPLPEVAPMPWLLGTSEKSAILAAENGMAYTFGQFMSDKDGSAIVKKYVESFKPRKQGQTPQVMVTVSAFCAETTEEAEDIALSSLIWSLRKEGNERQKGIPSIQEAKAYKLNVKEKEMVRKMKQNIIIGNPQVVKQKLTEIQAKYKADEIMINTNTYFPKDRIRSYELIAREVLVS